MNANVTPLNQQNSFPMPDLTITNTESTEVTATMQGDPKILALFKNLTPPGISTKTCESLMRKYHMGDWNVLNDDQQRVLSYLFAKGVHSILEEDDKDSKTKVGKKLLEAADKDTAVGRRAHVIVTERGMSFQIDVPNDVHTYDEFLVECPFWALDLPNTNNCKDFMNSSGKMRFNVLARNSESGEARIVTFQQVQKSGNCYLHAAVLVYQYLLQWHGISNVHVEDGEECTKKVVDIPQLMRHKFTKESMKNHIFDEGGSSPDVLKMLCGQRKVILLSKLANFEPTYLVHRDVAAGSILYWLSVSGPLLFTGAILPYNFGDSTTVKTGANAEFPSGMVVERHAMVLLGIRKESPGKWYFLFQNSHQTTQFFEADYDWVAASQGDFYAFSKQTDETWNISNKECLYVVDSSASYSEASQDYDGSDCSDQFVGNEKLAGKQLFE